MKGSDLDLNNSPSYLSFYFLSIIIDDPYDKEVCIKNNIVEEEYCNTNDSIVYSRKINTYSTKISKLINLISKYKSVYVMQS